jgi:hypothetical protein
MRAGVLHVYPLEDVAYKGALVLSLPTATNITGEAVTLTILATADELFIRAGVLHVYPSFDVAYKGAIEESTPTATNKPDEFLTVTACILA